MATKITFFPVGNGDMTLVQFADGQVLQIDVKITSAADDEEDDDTPDVSKLLRDRLPVDDKGRHYVDAFLLSHPDEDHCLGLVNHFYLGPPSDYPDNSGKIFVKEIWSSPLVFRRASTLHVLCDDARAFNAEARRRVAKYRESGENVVDGDRILVLGEDHDGKTDDILGIVVKTDSVFASINGGISSAFEARLLAPLSSIDEEEEAILSKNQSSTILNFTFAAGGLSDVGRFLTGGDADVAIWEKIWSKYHELKSYLAYDVLQTPHHCSWHSLSYDSWSEYGEGAELSADARSALGQARNKPTLIASSKAITDDDSDPPCIRAKREYEDIADEAQGEFLCTMEYIEEEDAEVLEIEFDANGKNRKSGGSGPITPVSFSPSGSNPLKSEKRGGGRYG